MAWHVLEAAASAWRYQFRSILANSNARSRHNGGRELSRDVFGCCIHRAMITCVRPMYLSPFVIERYCHVEASKANGHCVWGLQHKRNRFYAKRFYLNVCKIKRDMANGLCSQQWYKAHTSHKYRKRVNRGESGELLTGNVFVCVYVRQVNDVACDLSIQNTDSEIKQSRDP